MRPTSSSSILRREWWILGLILTLALLLRLAVVHKMSGLLPVSDELAYLKMARHLVEGSTVADTAGSLAFYNVGYPLFLLAPVEALFGPSLSALRMANALVSTLTCLLCWQLARAAGATRPWRLVAALAWALYLPAAVYSAYLLKEGLMGFLLMAWLCVGLHLSSGGNWRAAALAGLLCGALALVGNAALVVLPVLLWGIWQGRRSARDLGLKVAAFAMAAALVVTPWLVRNERLLGHAVLNTNGGFNLYLGNNPAATGMFVSIAETPLAQQWHQGVKASEYEASAALKKAAIQWMKDHPLEFGALAIKKLGLFWTPPVHEGQGPSSTAERAARHVWALEYLVLTALALAGIAAGWRQRDSARLQLLACLVLYSAVHMLFYVVFRYRETVMPVVCVIAATGAQALWQYARRHRPKAPA